MREFTFKEAVISDPSYGSYPGLKPIEELKKRGLIILDKPKGPTSHQVAGWVKDILEVKKAGHTGTLDPKVTGVLIVALEKSTKVVPLLKDLKKEYVALMVTHDEVEDGALRKTLGKFQGDIKQTPPKRSAVKRRERTRYIDEIDLKETEGRKVLIKIKCEAGTYVRKLIHDIGTDLGCGAHMKELRRTSVGPFGEDRSVKLQDIKDDYVFFQKGKNEDIRKDILPMETVADISKCIIIKDTAIEAVCSGANLGAGGVAAVEENIEEGDTISLLSGKGEMVAVGEACMNSKDISTSKKGVAASLINVTMDRETYPKGWK